MYRGTEKKVAERVGKAVKSVTLHRAHKAQEKGAARVMPLRRVYDPPAPAGPDEVVPNRTSTVQHVPFSSADVCNWRNQNP